MRAGVGGVYAPLLRLQKLGGRCFGHLPYAVGEVGGVYSEVARTVGSTPHRRALPRPSRTYLGQALVEAVQRVGAAEFSGLQRPKQGSVTAVSGLLSLLVFSRRNMDV